MLYSPDHLLMYKDTFDSIVNRPEEVFYWQETTKHYFLKAAIQANRTDVIQILFENYDMPEHLTLKEKIAYFHLLSGSGEIG